MAVTKRQATVKNARNTSDDRTPSILKGAEMRLRRLGKKRGRPDVQRAYRAAADKIKQLVKK